MRKVFEDFPYHEDPSDKFLYGTVKWQELDEDQQRDISDTIIHSLRDVNESIDRHGYVTATIRDFNRRLVRELGAAEYTDSEAPNNMIPIPDDYKREPGLAWQARALYGVSRASLAVGNTIERACLWLARRVFQLFYDISSYCEYWADPYHKDSE